MSSVMVEGMRARQAKHVIQLALHVVDDSFAGLYLGSRWIVQDGLLMVP